jgi:hypothetical protein
MPVAARLFIAITDSIDNTEGKSWTIYIFRKMTFDTVTLNIVVTVLLVVITVVSPIPWPWIVTDLFTLIVAMIVNTSGSSSNLSPLFAAFKASWMVVYVRVEPTSSVAPVAEGTSLTDGETGQSVATGAWMIGWSIKWITSLFFLYPLGIKIPL